MLLVGGETIGFVKGTSAAGPTSWGTLGGFVRDPNGTLCAVTNLHVVDSALKVSTSGYAGKAMDVTGYQVFLKTLSDPRYGRYDADADFAITPVLANNTVNNAVMKNGASTPLKLGKTNQIVKDARVYKVGQNTLYTTGKIKTVQLAGPLPRSYQQAGQLQIKNAFVIEPTDGLTEFCSDGDSGSLVVLADSDEVIGLLFKKCSIMSKDGDFYTCGIAYPFATQIPDSFTFIDTSNGPIDTTAGLVDEEQRAR